MANQQDTISYELVEETSRVYSIEIECPKCRTSLAFLSIASLKDPMLATCSTCKAKITANLSLKLTVTSVG